MSGRLQTGFSSPITASVSGIAENLKEVQNRIAAAAVRCRREPSSIQLVCVSKMQPATAVREAFEAGARVFGENYAQELRDKAAELSDLSISWHFIGHLQKNKAKYVAPIAACVETVDSREIAEALSRRAPGTMRCMIEVNVAGELSKSGISPDDAPGLARSVAAIENAELLGFMTIPPYDEDPEKGRLFFRRLKEVRDAAAKELGIELPGLSMGMSHDLEVAIEEGATIVRVGTAIFGERDATRPASG